MDPDASSGDAADGVTEQGEPFADGPTGIHAADGAEPFAAVPPADPPRSGSPFSVDPPAPDDVPAPGASDDPSAPVGLRSPGDGDARDDTATVSGDTVDDSRPADEAEPSAVPEPVGHTAPVGEPVAEDPAAGCFEPFSIGDPGRAATLTVPKFDAEFPAVPDVRAHGSVVPVPAGGRGLEVRAASLSGLSHRFYGRACQDAYALACSEDGEFLVVAVADGLGSAPRSHLASGIAARKVVDGVAAALGVQAADQLDWPALLADAGDAVIERGRSELAAIAAPADQVAPAPDPVVLAPDQVATSTDPAAPAPDQVAPAPDPVAPVVDPVTPAPSQMAAEVDPGAPAATEPPPSRAALVAAVRKVMCTTLVVAVVPVRPGPDGAHRCVVVRVGDSSAWVLERGQVFVSTGSVKNDGVDIASSATAALPMGGVAVVDPVPVELRHGDALLLMSDGVGDPLGTGDGEVGAVLAQWWCAPPPLVEFIGQVDFGRKSFDDDRTVVAVWPAAQP